MAERQFEPFTQMWLPKTERGHNRWKVTIPTAIMAIALGIKIVRLVK